MAFDLVIRGGRVERYVVDAVGYRAVIVNGEVLLEECLHTRALPGHFLRGA